MPTPIDQRDVTLSNAQAEYNANVRTLFLTLNQGTSTAQNRTDFSPPDPQNEASRHQVTIKTATGAVIVDIHWTRTSHSPSPGASWVVLADTRTPPDGGGYVVPRGNADDTWNWSSTPEVNWTYQLAVWVVPKAGYAKVITPTLLAPDGIRYHILITNQATGAVSFEATLSGGDFV